jgi:hypothetical protein
MSDELVTMPETSNEVSEESTDVDATPEADGEEQQDLQASKKEAGQLDFIDELKKSGQIPKGVEPFRDEKGELKFIIPINGKKYVANFKQVLGGFNLNQAGEQKLKQGKEIEQKFNNILNSISANAPEGKKELKKFLTKLGYDLGDLSEGYLNDVIAERSMTPEERDNRKRLEDLEERERKLAEKEKQSQLTEEQRAIQEKQQKYSSDIVNAMKSRKLDNVNPELKKNLMKGVIGEMIQARQADYNLTAEEALDNVLQQYDMLLDSLPHLYSQEHMKRRRPKAFQELVMKMSLEKTPPVQSSIKPGRVELTESQAQKIKQTNKNQPRKINLSDW